jgi:prophage regulatory protein
MHAEQLPDCHPFDKNYPDSAARAAGFRPTMSGAHVQTAAKERILRLPEVKVMVGLGTTAVYQRIKHGDFPPPIKLGRLSGWLESEIQQWIKKQILACRS